MPIHGSIRDFAPIQLLNLLNLSRRTGILSFDQGDQAVGEPAMASQKTAGAASMNGTSGRQQGGQPAAKSGGFKLRSLADMDVSPSVAPSASDPFADLDDDINSDGITNALSDIPPVRQWHQGTACL